MDTTDQVDENGDGASPCHHLKTVSFKKIIRLHWPLLCISSLALAFFIFFSKSSFSKRKYKSCSRSRKDADWEEEQQKARKDAKREAGGVQIHVPRLAIIWHNSFPVAQNFWRRINWGHNNLNLSAWQVQVDLMWSRYSQIVIWSRYSQMCVRLT
jgi:hypothetical protein